MLWEFMVIGGLTWIEALKCYDEVRRITKRSITVWMRKRDDDLFQITASKELGLDPDKLLDKLGFWPKHWDDKGTAKKILDSLLS